jgi:hypothetical protein
MARSPRCHRASASITGSLIRLGAVVTAFAGVVTDSLTRAFGVHRRRLHRLISALCVELKGGRQAFQVRDHYAARILDLVDLAGLSGRRLIAMRWNPMCGRYSQLRSWSDLVRLYNITADQTPLNLAPRYNIRLRT